MADPNDPLAGVDFSGGMAPAPMADVTGENTAVNTTGEADASLVGAHFRQTIIGGALNSSQLSERLWPTDETPVDTDKLIELIEQNNMWGHEDKFLHVRNMGQWAATLRDVRQDNADEEVMRDHGILTNFAAGMGVGLANPMNWATMFVGMPFMAGRTTLQAAGISAGLFGGVAAAQEPIHHYLHTNRDLQSSVLAISASTLLGGIIGAAPGTADWIGTNAGPIARRYRDEVAGWFRGPDYQERYLEAARERLALINEEIALYPAGRRIRGGGQAPSVAQVARRDEAFDALQAAEERARLYNDNQMYRTGPAEFMRTVGARFIGQFKPSFLDPSDFIMKRGNSLEARLGYQKMAEVNQLLNKNVAHRSSTGDAQATAQAATTELDPFHGGWARFHGDMWGTTVTASAQRIAGNVTGREWGNSAFNVARRAGFQGGTEEFNREVANAIVSGFTHHNPGVQRAAESYRDNIVEPVRQLMIRAGYPDPGNNPRFALGYMPRRYLIPNVRGPDGRGTVFLQLARRHYLLEQLDRLTQRNGSGYVPTNAEMGQARRRARELARRAYGEITRDDPGDLVGGIRWQDHTPGTPFEERVVPIPDIELLRHGMISYDVSELANNMIRSHVPALLYAERFKTATGLPDPSLEHSLLPAIQREYSDLVTAVGGRDADLLNRERDTMLEVMRNRRDILFHGARFSFEKNVSKAMERAVAVTQTYQAVRVLSNLLVSSLPDVAGLQIHHGMSRQFRALANDIRRWPGIRNFTQGVSREEAITELKAAGAAIEWQTNAAMAVHMDMGMPYQAGASTVERAMHNISRAFSVSNFSVQWNDMMKGKAYRATLDRILDAAGRGWPTLPAFERQWLANHGIDGPTLNRIGYQWRMQSAPMNDGFLRWANLSQWADQATARALVNAINKNRASTIIQPRTGDKSAIWEANPLARLINQFQNFVMSHTLRVLTLAEQRLMADGFAGRDSLRVYGGLFQYVALGAVSAYLTAAVYDLSFGVKPGEKSRADRLLDNPGQWLSHAIEKSGVLGLFGNYNQMMERAGIPGVNKAISSAAGDPATQNQKLSNWQSLGTGERMVKAVAGPTFSQAVDVGRFAINGINAAAGGPSLSKRDMQVPSQIFPWQNNILLRRYVLEPANKWLWEDQLGQRYNR
jgi:hypothetical protein